MAAKHKKKKVLKSKSPKKGATSAKKSSGKKTVLSAFFKERLWAKHWMQLAALLVLSFVLYGASINFGYVLDDTMVIKENLYVNPTDTEYELNGAVFPVKDNMAGIQGAPPSFGERIKKIFGADTFQGYFKKEQKLLEGGRYRPLSLVTFAIEWQLLGGLSPRFSHFMNILLYALSAWLLYRILLGFFPIKNGQQVWFSVAFLGAAFFLLHPLHTEAVANIKGRDEIMALMGSLGALWAAMKYTDTQKIGWAALAGFILFWAMMAKENSITFLAVIPLSLWFFGKTRRKALGTVFAFLCVAAFAFIAVRQSALGYFLNPGKEITDVMNNPFYGMSIGERMATIFLTLGWYIKLLFVPHPLTHDYYPYHVPKVGWDDWRALLSLAAYIGMGIYAVLNLKKRKVIAWCILFFLATLSIVSNIFVSVGTFMNERFLYMPSLAFAVLTAWFLAKQIPTWIKETPQKFNYISGAIALVLVFGYAFATITRVPDWKNRMSLNSSALERSPNSARANCFMATALYEDVFKKTLDKEEKKRLLGEMSALLDKSLEIYPYYGSALIMRAGVAGETFLMDNQLDKLFHEFDPIIRLNPSMDYIHQFMVYLGPRVNNAKYSSFCHKMGYKYFFKERRDYQNALKYLNYGVEANYNINGSKGDERLLNDMAEVYKALGNTAKAEEYKRKAAIAAQ